MVPDRILEGNCEDSDIEVPKIVVQTGSGPEQKPGDGSPINSTGAWQNCS